MSTRPISPTVIAFALACAASARAAPFTNSFAPGDVDPFSKAFRGDYRAAGFGSGGPGEAKRFEALLPKYRDPCEQAELHVTLGVIYNQRTGQVDRARSVVHMTEALKYSLPQIPLAQVRLWRGCSFAVLGRRQRALRDYVMGLAVCLRFDLPAKVPDPPVFERLPDEAPPGDPENDRLGKEVNRRCRDYDVQTELISLRYFLVESVKEVLADDEGGALSLEETVNSWVDGPAVRRKIMALVASPNERPWK